MSPVDRLKALLWACIVPIFPHLRDGMTRLGVLRHNIRQHYPLGWLAPGRTIEGLKSHLAMHGFGNHFIAWIDLDEIAGIRKRVNFHFQYHLRIFRDREIRGHYEWTPESRPFIHMLEIGMEERREEFLRFLGDWVVPHRTSTTR